MLFERASSNDTRAMNTLERSAFVLIEEEEWTSAFALVNKCLGSKTQLQDVAGAGTFLVKVAQAVAKQLLKILPAKSVKVGKALKQLRALCVEHQHVLNDSQKLILQYIHSSCNNLTDAVYLGKCMQYLAGLIPGRAVRRSAVSKIDEALVYYSLGDKSRASKDLKTAGNWYLQAYSLAKSSSNSVVADKCYNEYVKTRQTGAPASRPSSRHSSVSRRTNTLSRAEQSFMSYKSSVLPNLNSSMKATKKAFALNEPPPPPPKVFKKPLVIDAPGPAKEVLIKPRLVVIKPGLPKKKVVLKDIPESKASTDRVEEGSAEKAKESLLEDTLTKQVHFQSDTVQKEEELMPQPEPARDTPEERVTKAALMIQKNLRRKLAQKNYELMKRRRAILHKSVLVVSSSYYQVSVLSEGLKLALRIQHVTSQEETVVDVNPAYRAIFLDTSLLRDVLTIFIFLHREPITPESRSLFDRYYGKSVTVGDTSYLLDKAFFGKDLPAFTFYKTETLPATQPLHGATPLREDQPSAPKDVLARVSENIQGDPCQITIYRSSETLHVEVYVKKLKRRLTAVVPPEFTSNYSALVQSIRLNEDKTELSFQERQAPELCVERTQQFGDVEGTVSIYKHSKGYYASVELPDKSLSLYLGREVDCNAILGRLELKTVMGHECLGLTPE